MPRKYWLSGGPKAWHSTIMASNFCNGAFLYIITIGLRVFFRQNFVQQFFWYWTQGDFNLTEYEFVCLTTFSASLCCHLLMGHSQEKFQPQPSMRQTRKLWKWLQNLKITKAWKEKEHTRNTHFASAVLCHFKIGFQVCRDSIPSFIAMFWPIGVELWIFLTIIYFHHELGNFTKIQKRENLKQCSSSLDKEF